MHSLVKMLQSSSPFCHVEVICPTTTVLHSSTNTGGVFALYTTAVSHPLIDTGAFVLYVCSAAK